MQRLFEAAGGGVVSWGLPGNQPQLNGLSILGSVVSDTCRDRWGRGVNRAKPSPPPISPSGPPAEVRVHQICSGLGVQSQVTLGTQLGPRDPHFAVGQSPEGGGRGQHTGYSTQGERNQRP